MDLPSTDVSGIRRRRSLILLLTLEDHLHLDLLRQMFELSLYDLVDDDIGD